LLPFVAFQSCKKAASPGDNYDFSSSLPPYVALSSTAARSIKNPTIDTTVAVGFLVRTALQQSITVTYSVSGAITQANQTVTIPRNAVSVNASIPFAKNILVAPTTSLTATVTLLRAVAADGTVLALGANNVASAQKVDIRVVPQ
jgi:hypothetical protein